MSVRGAPLTLAQARLLRDAGARLLGLSTNTMQKAADRITEAIETPLIQLADTTAHEVRALNLTTLGLLATRYTMEEDFYIGRLRDRHGLNFSCPTPRTAAPFTT